MGNQLETRIPFWCVLSTLPSLYLWGWLGVWEWLSRLRPSLGPVWLIDFTLRFAVPSFLLIVASVVVMKKKGYRIFFMFSALFLKTMIDVSNFTAFYYVVLDPVSYLVGLGFIVVTIINLFLLSYLAVKLHPDWRSPLFAPLALSLYFAIFDLPQGLIWGYDLLTLMGVFHLLTFVVVVLSLFARKRIVPQIGSIAGGLIIVYALITLARLHPAPDNYMSIKVLDFFFLAPYLITYGFIRLLTRFKLKKRFYWK